MPSRKTSTVPGTPIFVFVGGRLWLDFVNTDDARLGEINRVLGRSVGSRRVEAQPDGGETARIHTCGNRAKAQRQRRRTR